jgi:ABC-2 type transport system permease protein
MTTLTRSVRDSATMLRRDIRHALRYPLMTVSSLLMQVFFLVLFAGVFGRTLRAGIGGGHYIDYLAPAMILMTACSTAEAVAVNVSTDMTEGIITRFRTMAISQSSVLTGQVLGGLLRSLVGATLIVGVAMALGFRPTASPAAWLAATAVFALLAFGLTWLTVAFGLVAKTPAGANSLSLLVVVLPFVSSAFVPTSTMPSGIRWFATNQPFTPVIGTLRGLLCGGPVGHDSVLAALWGSGIAAAGSLWAWRLYARTPAR